MAESQGRAVRFTGLSGLADHVEAYRAKKDERDGMTECCGIVDELPPDIITSQRQQYLEDAEPEPDSNVMPCIRRPYRESFALGYGKGVQRNADGKDEEFKYRHAAGLLSKRCQIPRYFLRPSKSGEDRSRGQPSVAISAIRCASEERMIFSPSGRPSGNSNRISAASV